MANARQRIVVALLCGVGLVACDDDPNSPSEEFEFLGCPVGRQSVNAPLVLQFSAPVNPATVTAGNLVVSTAATGLEVPGSIAIDPTDSTRVTFTPSQALRFDETLRVRVQNLRSARTNTQVPVGLCEFTTELPPITEIVWRELPSASGSNLEGISLLPSGLSHVITIEGALYRRNVGENFNVAFQSAYFTGGGDVDFLDASNGFASFRNTRTNEALVLRTVDGAVNFDTLAAVPGTAVNVERLYFEPAATPRGYFGVAGGGTAASSFFLKFSATNPPAAFTRQNFSGTGAVNDIDFAKPDTLNGVAVSRGVRVGTTVIRGRFFTTANGGATWTQVPGADASDTVLTYLGVARLSNGTVFVAGGNGFFARFTPGGTGGTFTQVRLLQNALANPDTTDPLALQFTDVQFAPNNSQIGWVIGKQLVGFIGETPRFQGFIFQTRDGGNTWTRQGVIGAANYGAEFPGLNRLDVVSPTLVQIAGDAGAVFEYAPDAAPGTPAGTP